MGASQGADIGHISIHALLAESDNRFGRPIDVQLVFLSTLSLRRATSCGNSETQSDPVFLSTLSLRRATGNSSSMWCSVEISIHALLAESDRRPGLFFQVFSYFYPRSPCGERPLGGRAPQPPQDFYPRSPCGERPWCISRSTPVQAAFLSTLSLRRATTNEPI